LSYCSPVLLQPCLTAALSYCSPVLRLSVLLQPCLTPAPHCCLTAARNYHPPHHPDTHTHTHTLTHPPTTTHTHRHSHCRKDTKHGDYPEDVILGVQYKDGIPNHLQYNKGYKVSSTHYLYYQKQYIRPSGFSRSFH